MERRSREILRVCLSKKVLPSRGGERNKLHAERGEGVWGVSAIRIEISLFVQSKSM